MMTTPLQGRKKKARTTMEGIEWMGSVCRIRECAFEFLSMEDDLFDDDEDSWELMGRDLSLKSTFLYCDLHRIISCASDDRRKTLTDLANRLFHYMEELGNAVKIRSASLTQVRYSDAAIVLQEVMAALLNHPLSH